MTARVYVEEWADGLGEQLSIEDGVDGPGSGEIVERPDRGRLAVSPDPAALTDRPLAFVDGVRRVDVPLQAHLDDGRVVFGIAGSHAHGAAIARAGRVDVERMAVKRLVIWGSSETVALRSRTRGIAWDVRSVDDEGPDAPLAELQQCMRKAEGRLAESLMDAGAVVVCDGPLNYVLAGELPICGYVKTHQFAHLPAELHREVPALAAGERSVIFKTAGRERRYSAYMRIEARDLPRASPWRGIVRLEVPQARGLDVARRVIDEMTLRLGAFGAAAHKDSRAPVNLRPIAALEKQLRHRLGHPRLIATAARHAAIETEPAS
jgi:hypothetical protein